MANRVWVVGSLNADLVMPAVRLPAWGETIAGGQLQTLAGGKGANQACAAARMGACTVMIGCVGEDDLGRFLNTELDRAGVDTSLVEAVPGENTGSAIIFVRNEDGANAIALSPGANARLTPAKVERHLRLAGPGDVLLCQLETPPETVLAALRMARRTGLLSLLDPAPAQGVSNELLRAAGIVTPNESEAASVVGRSDGDPSDTAQALREAGAEAVLLKLGAHGAFWMNRREVHRVHAFRVDRVVDTTAAGDTFNGAFAAARAGGAAVEESLRIASAAAAISVTRRGAQASIPTADEVRAFLAAGPANIP